MPHVCSILVPGVCAYLGVYIILKYTIRGFQRRVPIVYTTKTRFCSSICVNVAENRDFLLQEPNSNFFAQNHDFCPKRRRSHMALGMSDFNASATVGKEIVHSF